MTSTLTHNGQITIPKKIRDELNLQPGCQLNVVLNSLGVVILEKVPTVPEVNRRAKAAKFKKANRFEQVRGKADIHWRTQDLMKLFRGET